MAFGAKMVRGRTARARCRKAMPVMIPLIRAFALLPTLRWLADAGAEVVKVESPSLAALAGRWAAVEPSPYQGNAALGEALSQFVCRRVPTSRFTCQIFKNYDLTVMPQAAETQLGEASGAH